MSAIIDFIKRNSKPLVFALCLLPLAYLITLAVIGHLGANPIEKFTRGLGDWALRLLLITLCVTPLRRLMVWNSLIKLRRMLGLFAFFYVCVHVASYLVLDQFFAWDEVLKDIIKRPFITVGFASFVLLIPLAVTSTNNMVKRLGGKHWQRLHRPVYLIGIGGVLHYLWMVKADVRQPLLYAGLLTLLLGYRLWVRYIQPGLNSATQAVPGVSFKPLTPPFLLTAPLDARRFKV